MRNFELLINGREKRIDYDFGIDTVAEFADVAGEPIL